MSMPQLARNNPIGVFDSGIGGLTVVQQLIKLLPGEQIHYFGDTARMPYGEKSSETIRRFAIENTIFLMHSNIKLLVVACNTASAHSIHKLRQLFNVPMVDVVEAGVNQVVSVTKNQQIAVLGTKGTIHSNVYQREILSRLPDANVISVACPLLAPLVEENFVGHPAARLIVSEYLAPLKNTSVDTVLLGCTHYPLLAPLIREELPGIEIVDSAVSCAAMVAALLAELNLEAKDSFGKSAHRFYVSDDPQKFCRLATHFLGSPLEHVEKVSSWV